MLTEKEVKFLNFLYKKLKGKHLEFPEGKKYIQKTFKLDDKFSFEMAFLYDKNFEQSDGDFNNVKTVKRLNYRDFTENLNWELLAVMEMTKDYNIENYEINDYGLSDLIEHNGISYFVYKNEHDMNVDALKVIENFMRDDPHSYVDYIIDNTSINTVKRIDIAIHETNKYVNEKLTTYEKIIEEGEIKDEFDELETAKEDLNNTLGQLINTIQLMDDYLKLHRLGKEEEDNEEYIKLNGQIKTYREILIKIQKIFFSDTIKEDMTIDEITNEVDETLYEIDLQIEDLIENTKQQLREKKYEEIYDILENNPYDYFQDKLDLEPQEYIDLNYVNIDYPKSAYQYLSDTDMTFAEIMNFSEEKIITIKGKKYYIFW